MSKPSIRTTVVGSYPVPAWLQAYPSRPNLRDAILVVLKEQELAGLDVISDGELARFDVNHPETQGMIDYFIRPLDGIETRIGRAALERFEAEGRLRYRAQPAGVVAEALGAGTLNLRADLDFVRGLTATPLRTTLTSPYMLARVLVDLHYKDERELTREIAKILGDQVAELDASVVQVDEAHLTGHPEDVEWAVEAINLVLERARGETAVHLCFGNYGGQTVQKGFWKDLLPFFNGLEADHVVLEFARRGFAELQDLKGVKPEVKIGVGVVDVKDNQVEDADTVAARIERAVEILGADRVAWVHPDCGLWMLPRTVANGKLRAVVEGRDRFLGRG